MSALVSCPSCDRHVRAAEARCPFCGGSIEAVAPTPSPARRGGLGRAALVALGTTLGASGCFSAAPAYGAPPIDAGPDAGSNVAPDAGSIAPAYGAPAIDGG